MPVLSANKYKNESKDQLETAEVNSSGNPRINIVLQNIRQRIQIKKLRNKLDKKHTEKKPDKI